MTRLEKALEMMHEADAESTTWIKCTNVDRFIKIIDTIEESNQHTFCHDYLREIFLRKNNTVFIKISKYINKELIYFNFFDTHYGNVIVNDVDCLKDYSEKLDKNKVEEPEMRLLDIKIKELLDTKGDCKPIAISVDSVERLEHIIQIINSYRTMKIGVQSTSRYFQQLKVSGECLRVYIDGNKELTFRGSSKVNYSPWEIIKDVDILKPVKTPESLCPNVVHALDAIYNNNNAENMIDNFFEAMLGQSEKQTKQINSGENKMKKDVLKVFDKGQVDIKQVIVQMYLKDLEPNAQFVNELVRKELARIKNEIVTNFTPIHNLDTYNLKFLASVNYLEDIKNCDSEVDLECAYMFYVYEKEIAKELRLTGKPDYSWIKDFIIQKNVMSQKRVNLFKSNKFEIFIESGSIHFVDIKPNTGYSIDIKYNEETNTFHL